MKIILNLFLLLSSYIFAIDISLSEKEQTFLKSKHQFNVCSLVDRFPITAQKDGKLLGIAGDVYTRLEKELNIKFNILKIDSNIDFENRIKANDCDFISIINKEQTKFKNIQTSIPIFNNYLSSLGNINSFFINDFKNIKSHTFYVSSRLQFQHLTNKYPYLNVKLSEDINLIMEEVKKNEKVHLLDNIIVLSYILEKYGADKFKINGVLQNSYVQGSIGISKEYPLLIDIINKTLSNIEEDFFKLLIENYTYKTPKIINNYDYLFYIILVFLGIISMIVWRYKLIHENQKIINKQTKQLEEALENQKLSSKKYESLFKTSNVVIAMIDSDGVMFELNDFGQSFSGYTIEELSKEPFKWKCLLEKEIQEQVVGIIENAKEGYILKSFQNAWISKTGEKKVFEWSNVLVKKDDGSMDYIATIGIDVTYQTEQQELLILAKKSADDANKAKSAFLANMSHEIRTPLNGIIGLTNIVLETKLEKTQKDYLNKVKFSSNSLLQIINDILDYSKIEAGKLNISNSNFSLNSLLENLSNLFSYKIYEKNLEFNYIIEQEIPNNLRGDNLRIMQVLCNFMGNAIKFTHSGHICLKVSILEKTKDSIKLEFIVSDTGIGISQDNQHKLFKSFSQEDDSTTKKYGGTGLGLVISKQLIELMGGEIFFESKKGFGSKFGFKLDFEYENSSSINKNSTSYLKHKSFLIIDDNEIDRKHISAILNSWNIQSKEARDGQEAYEIILKQSFDYLIVDWKMPRIDGLSLIERLQKENIDIPNILMVTAFKRNEILKIAQKRNIFIEKVLEKPYTPSSLFNILFEKEHYIEEEKSNLRLSSKKLALIVEDNEINQVVAEKILESIGFETHIAQNGQIAVEKVEKNKYDIIFMDLQMPVMDGFEASKIIRKKGFTIPIIALSAAVMPKDKELTRQSGMNSHIAKPFNKKELFEILKQYFETKSEKKLEQTINLPQIDGIDIGALKEQLGLKDEELFSMYKRFKENYSNFKELEKSTPHTKEFNEYLHKLKGVSGNLKINSIYNLTKEIYDKENIEKIPHLIKELNNICYEIDTKIIPLIKEESPNLSKNETLDLLNETLNAYENFEYVSPKKVDFILKSLKEIISKRDYTVLKDGLNNHMYESVVETLINIKKDYFE